MENPPTFSKEFFKCCRQGNHDAWRELILGYEETVTRWIARMGFWLGPEEIADLRQEVFLKMIRGFQHYDDNYPFKAWCYQQTESRFIDYQRALSAQKRPNDRYGQSLDAPLDEDGTTMELPDHRSIPSEQAMEFERHRQLHVALNQLGPHDSRCRQLIGRSYFGGFSYEEIALQMELNPKTVSASLSKCLSALRPIARAIFSGGKISPFTNE